MALVIYEEITGQDPRNLPGSAVVAGHTLSTSQTTVRLLRRVAHETVSLYARQ